METLDIQYGVFVVNDRPYCLWDYDLRATTLEFVKNYDAEYVNYLADTNFVRLQEDNPSTKQHSALAIRSAFSQGLETLFAFLIGAIQAPYCFPAWLNLYRNSDLIELVTKIGHYQSVLSFPEILPRGWNSISEAIHVFLTLEDQEREKQIKDNFGILWSRFASTFLDESFREEYNSLKHGIRLTPGGFHISIGAEDIPGIPAPKEKMQLLGKSDYGSSFKKIELFPENNWHVNYEKVSRNWSPEDMSWGLHLISISLNNIIAYLKIQNGVNPEGATFQWPSDIETFAEPWKRTIALGVTSMRGFRYIIPQEIIEPFSKQDILIRYKSGKVIGTRSMRINRQE